MAKAKPTKKPTKKKTVEPKEKRPIGRPPLYETPEALQEKIAEYISICWPAKMEHNGVETTPPILEEMIDYLGFTSYQSLTNYCDRSEDFNAIVKSAKAKCGYLLNKAGMIRKVDGRIAALNLASNYGIKEKKELTGADGGDLIPKKVIVEFENE